MITIKEISTKKDLKTFVKFPFRLYKNSKSWVPPIIAEEVRTLNKDENPVFKDAEARYFLAYKNNEIVGRVAAIINWLEVNGQSEKKMRFGWFDTIDDVEVTKLLLEKVHAIGKENNLLYVEGPVGFSNLDKVGILTEGFDELGSMITWHNHAYYAEHFKALGYEVGKAYSENVMEFKNILQEYFTRVQNMVKKRYQLRALNFSNNKDIMSYADEMFDVFSISHSVLSSFVEINQEQRDYFKKKFIGFLNPEYVKFVLDKDDNCNSEVGPASNNGCPEPVITEVAEKKMGEFAKTILFNSGRATFKAGISDKLDGIVKIMQEFSKATFLIEGHSDSTGRAESNQTLSAKRAAAVKDYLVQNGVDASRLDSKGYGEENPIDTNKTRAGRANNRRVEIKVTNE